MSRGKKKAEEVEKAVEQTQPDLEALESAAALLVDALPNETMRTILRETAVQHFVPLWIYLAGLIQRAYDTGEHTAPVLDPIWTRTNPVTMGDSGKSSCNHCNEPFTRRWPGQEYCCDLCGSAANLARSVSERENYRLSITTHKVGEEPLGSPRSTIYQAESDGGSPTVGEMGKEPGVPGTGPGEEDYDPIAEIEQAANKSLGLA